MLNTGVTIKLLLRRRKKSENSKQSEPASTGWYWYGLCQTAMQQFIPLRCAARTPDGIDRCMFGIKMPEKSLFRFSRKVIRECCASCCRFIASTARQLISAAHALLRYLQLSANKLFHFLFSKKLLVLSVICSENLSQALILYQQGWIKSRKTIICFEVTDNYYYL